MSEYNITWTDKYGPGSMMYPVKIVEKYVDEGDWVIVNKEPETAECTILDTIKQFTAATGASIFICNGEYEVYCENFICTAKDDVSLMEIITAFLVILTADAVPKEG